MPVEGCSWGGRGGHHGSPSCARFFWRLLVDLGPSKLPEQADSGFSSPLGFFEALKGSPNVADEDLAAHFHWQPFLVVGKPENGWLLELFVGLQFEACAINLIEVQADLDAIGVAELFFTQDFGFEQVRAAVWVHHDADFVTLVEFLAADEENRRADVVDRAFLEDMGLDALLILFERDLAKGDAVGEKAVLSFNFFTTLEFGSGQKPRLQCAYVDFRPAVTVVGKDHSTRPHAFAAGFDDYHTGLMVAGLAELKGELARVEDALPAEVEFQLARRQGWVIARPGRT